MIAGRNVVVRTCTDGDRSALEHLMAQAVSDVDGRKGGREAAMVDPFAVDHLFVATIGTAPVVGFAAVVLAPPTCTIRLIYVAVEFREIGIGAALLGATCDLARSEGCRLLDASALPGDRDTKNFFETHGLTAREIVVQRRL